MAPLRAFSNAGRKLVLLAFLLGLLLASTPAGRGSAQALTQANFSIASRAPVSVTAGDAGVPFLAFTVSVSAGSAFVNSITLTRLGTVTGEDIGGAGVRLWLDVNGNGIVDGLDQLRDAAPFINGKALANAGYLVSWTLAVQFIVTLDIRESASAGKTIGISIEDGSDIGLDQDVVVNGVFPAPSTLATVLGQGEGTAAVETGAGTIGDSGGTIVTKDGILSATLPAGATDTDLNVSISHVDASGLPTLPGVPYGPVYQLSLSDAAGGAAGVTLASPIRFELDLASLLTDGLDPSDLTIVALGEDGVWRALPTMLSADGTKIIISVSTNVTFSVVRLGGAASDLVPPQRRHAGRGRRQR